jgi:hypothetical protein
LHTIIFMTLYSSLKFCAFKALWVGVEIWDILSMALTEFVRDHRVMIAHDIVISCIREGRGGAAADNLNVVNLYVNIISHKWSWSMHKHNITLWHVFHRSKQMGTPNITDSLNVASKSSYYKVHTQPHVNMLALFQLTKTSMSSVYNQCNRKLSWLLKIPSDFCVLSCSLLNTTFSFSQKIH